MTHMAYTRRSFLETCAALATASQLGRAGTSAFAAEAGRTIFPYGTHVYREPSLPLEQLRADLPLLKRLGFTMIKIQESWSADERTEGEIDLSRVAQVVSDARQNGLLVYFGITMEQAPAWLWKKYPDARMEWESGERLTDPTQYLLPNDGKPGPCWNHPGARAAAIRFIEAVGKEIGRFENILVWNVWQEVAFDFGINRLGLCYCPNTLSAFRDWLQQKYGSLEALNRVWYITFGDWADIEPPRRFPKVPSMIDWRYFTENVYLAEALRWKADAFRRSDPGQRRILAHTGGPRYGGSSDWRLARAVDVYGSSCYPGWGEFQQPDVSDEQRVRNSKVVWQQVLDNAFKWDYIRSASVKGEFWTAELQGGRASGGIAPGRVPDPGDIRRWVLGALAGGARGICFWNHRSERFWDEAYGFGLMELDGQETPRMAEASRIAAAINAQAADLFASGESPRAPVAIVIDEDLWNFVNSSGDEIKNNFTSNLRGIHQALWQEGVPVDFLDAGDVASARANYKVLIHPFPVALSGEAIEALRNFVRGGGTLVSGPCPGRYDRAGFGVPGEMPRTLAELFGTKHKQIIPLSGRNAHPIQSTYTPENVAPLVLEGVNAFAQSKVQTTFYLQYLKTTTAEPILKFRDEVVGCSNCFGSGRAVLVGTLPGPAVLESGGGENQAFLARVLASAGVHSDRAGRLLRRRRRWNDRSAWFLFNPEQKTVEESVPVEGNRSARGLLGEPLQIESGNVRVKVGPMDVVCLLLAP
jgi:beta-galactosidase GanA